MGSVSHSSKRKKKRTQKHGEKKSRSIKEKSKKLKLDQNSDVDDKLASVSMVSGYSSRSEDNYRSRRRGGRKSDNRKVSKKKMKRDSSISDSSGDSHPLKKRKRSKKLRKKHIGKTKPRREPSSFSSDEYDSKRKLEKKGDKLEMKEREKDWERNRSKRSRHSSRSGSLSSLPSDEENPPKRLKSVIVVMREMEKAQVEEISRDEHKDEIVYEHDDDYPNPSRSNDSNDGTSRGEAFASSRDPSDEKTMYMEKPSKEASSLDLKMSEFSRIEKLDVERSEVSTADASSSSIDLETMLRQKALENLLKRQGKLPTKIEDGGNQDDLRIPSKVKDPDRYNLESAQKAGINGNVKHMTNVPTPIKDSAVHPPICKLETELHLEKGNASDYPVISRPKLGLSNSTIRLLGSSNIWRRDPTLQGSTRPNSSTPKETVVQDSCISIESQSPDTKIVAEKPERPVFSRGGSTKEGTKEVEDAEFEQKTMTVMRGGDLVQVSYKVKIPKKTPALVRRQFKR